MSIPADLSKKLFDVFKEQMKGKTHTEDLQAALDLVGETALRWAQEKLG